MKFSIITATKNNKAGLLRAIESVRSQTYKNVEHIIVDGGSTDGSIAIMDDVIWKMENVKFFSEADNGIYDAINKGIKLATGDVIGLLHSDDFFADEFVLGKYAEAFQDKRLKEKDESFIQDKRLKDKEKSIPSSRIPAGVRDLKISPSGRNDNEPPATDHQQPTIDAVYSDLVYVRSKKREARSENEDLKSIDHSALNIEHSVIRTWKTHSIENRDQRTEKREQRTENSEKEIVKSMQIPKQARLPAGQVRDENYSSPITDHLLLSGWMPPHPTLFVRKEIFDKYGLYRTDMKIAADYEMILRLFYKHKITTNYLPLTTYCMTIGGASNKSLKNIFIKSSEDYRAMKMHGIPFVVKTLLMKNLRKLPQFFIQDKR